MVSVDSIVLLVQKVCIRLQNASSHTLSIVWNTGIAVTAASIIRPIFMVDCPR